MTGKPFIKLTVNCEQGEARIVLAISEIEYISEYVDTKEGCLIFLRGRHKSDHLAIKENFDEVYGALRDRSISIKARNA